MKRRNFIKSGGLGLTGLGLSAPVLSMASETPITDIHLPLEDDDSVLNFHLMHGVFGDEAVHVLRIRPLGTLHLNTFFG
jgi:hypothetical protein